jgi:hypothetical protein
MAVILILSLVMLAACRGDSEEEAAELEPPSGIHDGTRKKRRLNWNRPAASTTRRGS